MFFETIFLSVILVLATNLFIWGSQRVGGPCSFLLSAFCFIVASSILHTAIGTVHCLCMIIAVMLFLVTAGRRFSFVKASVVATVIGYSIGVGVTVLPEIVEVYKLKRQYPLESLAERLSYETRETNKNDDRSPDLNSLADSPMPFAGSYEPELQEGQLIKRVFIFPRHRLEALKFVHSGFVNQFVSSPGFGFTRMPDGPSLDTLKKPKPLPFSLPPASSDDPNVPPESRGSAMKPRSFTKEDWVSGKDLVTLQSESYANFRFFR